MSGRRGLVVRQYGAVERDPWSARWRAVEVTVKELGTWEDKDDARKHLSAAGLTFIPEPERGNDG